MNRSESIKELATALSKVQGEMKGAIKDKMNPAFRSLFADLGACWDACRDPLTKHGLSIMQLPKIGDGAVHLETILMHSSGEFISEEMRIPVTKQDAQGYGSALTYCRRYALCAFVGIAPEDDDANGATQHKTYEKPVVVATVKPGEHDALAKKLNQAAKHGTKALEVAWKALEPEQRKDMAEMLQDLKEAASMQDGEIAIQA